MICSHRARFLPGVKLGNSGRIWYNADLHQHLAYQTTVDRGKPTVPAPTVVRPASMRDLALLNEHLHLWGPLDYHERKIEEQLSGGVLWLIAWRDGLPVGHLQIGWSGAERPEMASHLGDCPHVSRVGVRAEMRSQGIGSAMIEAAEDIIRKRGYGRVGLAVAIDNDRARRLYQRLGYRGCGHGTYTVSWYQYDGNEPRERVEEVCIYLWKDL
jgi:GNAT superfamily N-acetyltransferase